ncbi:hypothetical protein CRM22_008239, partial [Opisthorchis felineus]
SRNHRNSLHKNKLVNHLHKEKHNHASGRKRRYRAYVNDPLDAYQTVHASVLF